MNPTNLVLNKLESVCDRLMKSGRLTPAASKEARELHDEWRALILRSDNPSAGADQQEQMHAQADKLAAEIVDFLEGQLFLTFQANA
jgi:hypothetical protein